MQFGRYKKDELLQTFTHDGYVFLPGFIDTAGVDELRGNIERYIEQVIPDMPGSEVYYEERGEQSTLKQIQRMYQYDDYFQNLFTKSPLRELAETLLDDTVVPVNLQYFDKPPKVGQPTPPHQDGYYAMIEPCEAVTMWLALDHVDEANGCVRYIPGSHVEPMREHGRTKTLGFSQGIVDYGTPDDKERERAFPAHPGDLLVHHARTVHRADGNSTEDRHRRALGFIYFASRAKEDLEAKAAYQEKLTHDLEAQGKI